MKDEEILKKAFEKIREYVEEHSIEQDHIAEIFGVERSTVSKILSDSGKIEVSNINELITKYTEA